MKGLVHAHSGLRWLLLILLVVAILNAFLKKKKAYTATDKKINLFVMILMHTQLLIGFCLYFINESYRGFAEMSNKTLRFFAVEHLLGMIFAVVLITIGRKKAEKKLEDGQKFKTIAIFYGLALIIILCSIPWPFVIPTASWF